MLLSNSLTKVDVQDDYIKKWKVLRDAATEAADVQDQPSVPLSYSMFIRIGNADYPTLRLENSGSDFCDFCTGTKNQLRTLNRDTGIYEGLKPLLQEQRRDSRELYVNSNTFQASAGIHPEGPTKHLVFDFAEKVFFQKLLRQPGQLHFFTGLKFDFFGMSCSNEVRGYVFGMLEGHWPNEKIANSVVSMLHHTLAEQTRHGRSGGTCRRLVLHAENCGGQN